MTLISLVCLLALTSSAFGQYGYGDSARTTPIQQVPKLISIMRDHTVQRPVLPTLPVTTQGYGQQVQQPPVTTDWSTSMVPQDTSLVDRVRGSFGSALNIPTGVQRPLPINNFGSMQMIPQLDQTQVPQVLQAPVLTEADMQCRGQRPETVIPLEKGHRFIVCLDDSKGVIQHCPKGLYYHPQSQRCERKLGSIENPCVSQPCLNGGQCVPTETHYQCQCAAGFDGKTCELDARVCQTQQPCGQTTDTRCQSFRLGAALQYICILQEGLAYGLNPAQAQSSPCQGVDGPQALGVTNKGFIMCDGERMFVESCPGGTVWDDLNKACVWPDMQTVPQLLDQQQGYGQQSLSSKTTYGNQWAPQIQLPKPITMTIPQQLDIPKNTGSYGGYSSQVTIPQQLDIPKNTGSYGGYSSQVTMPQQLDIPKNTGSYGGYGSQVAVPQPSRVIQSFGDQIPIRRPIEIPKVVQSYGGQQQDSLLSVKHTSNY